MDPRGHNKYGGQRAVRGGAGRPNSHLLSPDVLDDETRRLLMEEVLHPVARLPPSPGASPRGRQRAGRPSTDGNGEAAFPAQLRARVGSSEGNGSELVAAMAGRLADLEKKQKMYRSEIAELHEKHRRLNDSLQKERKLREDAETATVELYEERKELEKELGDIKQFLRDYGLHWRGDGEGRTTPRTKAPPGSAGATPSARTDDGSNGGKDSKGERFDLYAGDFNMDGTSSRASPETVEAAGAAATPGGGQTPRLFNDSPSAQKAKAAGGKRRSPPDVALLKKNARILSDHVGWKGVVMDGKRAVIRDRDVVSVAVYSNGICVNRGAFRPYGWPLCDAFLNDLEEGFYPYEFKDRYPDGFPIEVVDHSTEACEAGAPRSSSPSSGAAAQAGSPKGSPPPLTPSVFAGGGGRRLGGPTPESVAVAAAAEAAAAAAAPSPPSPTSRARSPRTAAAAAAAGNVHSLQDRVHEKGYDPVSKNEFLSRIPTQRVTADGKLINVRDGVAAFFAGDRPAVDVGGTIKHVTADERAYHGAQSPGNKERKRANKLLVDRNAAASSSPSSPTASLFRVGNLVALLVRLPSGQKVTMHVEPTTSIHVVRQELAAAVPQFTQRNRYELCQAFPNVRRFDDHSQTLAALGISGSCTIMVKILPQK